MNEWAVPKVGIVISPPRDAFRQSKYFIKHSHRHWDTIASDYHHLANYHTTTNVVDTIKSSLTRTCFHSLFKESRLVDTIDSCLCGEEILVQQCCPFDQELKIENILIPYYGPLDNRRRYDVVFHYWARPYVFGNNLSQFELPQHRFKSRVCVRAVTPAMLAVEQTCPFFDMKTSAKFITRARPNGILHHVIVQDFVRSSLLCNTTHKRSAEKRNLVQRKSTQSGKFSRISKWFSDGQNRERWLIEERLVKETITRRLGVGIKYNLNSRDTGTGFVKDSRDDGYWSVEAKRLGGLAKWKSQYTTHIPMEFVGLSALVEYESESHRQDADYMNLLFKRIYNTLRPILIYNNNTVLPASYYMCFNQIPVTTGANTLPAESYSASARLCTLHLPILSPPILQETGTNTYQRSVLYNHAVHMVVTEGDTIWTGNVRFKPALSPHLDMHNWKETPLTQIRLKPGVYRWTAFQLGMHTTYSDCDQVERFTTECSKCAFLFAACETAAATVKNDHTPHFHLINTSITDRHRERTPEVFEVAPPLNGLNDYDRLIHLWACDKMEFTNCGIDMPFNWWNKIDSHLQSVEMWWPLAKMPMPFMLHVPDSDSNERPSMLNKVDLRHQWLGAATKLVVKNPADFFNRSLVSVEMCSGGTRGGGYTLLDATTLEVVGAILLDVRGCNRHIYECRRHFTGSEPDINRGACFNPLAGQNLVSDNHTLRDEPAAGIHFVPYSYQKMLRQYDMLSCHLVTAHDGKGKKRTGKARNNRVEECFARGISQHFTCHDFNITPGDVVNATRPFQTSRMIAKVNDKSLGPIEVYTIMNCDPYDQQWYGRLDGSPRQKLSNVSKQ